jgi:hypothetical protein
MREVYCDAQNPLRESVRVNNVLAGGEVLPHQMKSVQLTFSMFRYWNSHA